MVSSLQTEKVAKILENLIRDGVLESNPTIENQSVVH